MRPAKIARRLVLLEGVELSQVDLQAVIADLEAFDQALAELTPFAEAQPWLALQAQPDAIGGDDGLH